MCLLQQAVYLQLRGFFPIISLRRLKLELRWSSGFGRQSPEALLVSLTWMTECKSSWTIRLKACWKIISLRKQTGRLVLSHTSLSLSLSVTHFLNTDIQPDANTWHPSVNITRNVVRLTDHYLGLVTLNSLTEQARQPVPLSACTLLGVNYNSICQFASLQSFRA